VDTSLATQPITDDTDQPARKGGGNKGLEQAYIIRDIAANHAMELRDLPAETLQDKAARARALRDCTAVWEGADDRIRIKRGRPLPGSYKPERKPTTKKPDTGGPLEQVKE